MLNKNNNLADDQRSNVPGSPVDKKNIRGIVGDGMLCSEKELGLTQKNNGIIDPTPSIPAPVNVPV